jgi:hypothetical protein
MITRLMRLMRTETTQQTSMLPPFDIVAVVPVGPGTDPLFVKDTIDSFFHYTSATNKVLVLDDSAEGIGEHIRKTYPQVDLYCTPKPSGTMGGLYVSLCNAFRYALDNYDFKLILKLDTDALLTGGAPEKDALALVGKFPLTAIAGQYPLDYDGNPWDIGFPRDRILNGTTTWKGIKRPFANLVLRKHYLLALQNGYRTGESVFGGSYYISRTFVQKLREQNMLPDRRLRTLNLGEDHLFGLLAKTVGMELHSLSGKGQPFACAWKGLPASPQQLWNEGRKIIHSTRKWQNMNEEQIREYFRSKRTANATAPALQDTMISQG